jgi:hypothetical protein
VQLGDVVEAKWDAVVTTLESVLETPAVNSPVGQSGPAHDAGDAGRGQV